MMCEEPAVLKGAPDADRINNSRRNLCRVQNGVKVLACTGNEWPENTNTMSNNHQVDSEPLPVLEGPRFGL